MYTCDRHILLYVGGVEYACAAIPCCVLGGGWGCTPSCVGWLSLLTYLLVDPLLPYLAVGLCTPVLPILCFYFWFFKLTGSCDTGNRFNSLYNMSIQSGHFLVSSLVWFNFLVSFTWWFSLLIHQLHWKLRLYSILYLSIFEVMAWVNSS